MGQQNTKDTKRRRVGPPGTSVGAATRQPGVRSTAVNDSVLQQTSTGAARHTDPNRAHSSSRGSLPNMPSVGGANQGASATTFPIVLRYQDQDVRALIESRRAVYVAVEAMNWQPLPMTPSTDSFYALLELPAGNHNYRFLVNGVEAVDSSQPLAPSSATANLPVPPQPTPDTTLPPGVTASQPLPRPSPARDGKPANTIFLNDVLLTTREDDDIMDNGEGWGQEPIMFEESRKYPPIVPLHLRYTPLNTPPTLVRCSRDGRMAVMDSGLENNPRMPPEHLPLPLSVTINHVYFQRREDHAVMGVTTRYCNKFTTVVYYRHLPSSPVDCVEPAKG
ncbi:hypothetical protein ABB37_02180 [Leptomonas pyrrhocoris]|uniref:Association with the SNF1 complex (ASC) domain-containing protein n=1 Tax=Leptomonas pyrrhocoris TaxID=157538 RepID=A0A0N1J578_LEPPY|nr:hypothetical protein ABB37_02180 [Leptomonas pyrrhocoris]XP_015662504.1 hypothetical protein ABB37_02180 [Leptomonas pyrrhocoris]XP_015662505.1 hypothetical protein ABB37_02180 [Leptomonas pyrrhocoris]KPA84064.1 hypothetical protein ABB37_02180 [Leptomonas pyrrhocoris]KPA84065.1 hypothetical protein ABB37_02180 [Leptomonas pyrrhocoris]KPA84066.1 hypothetical protein ABB37_02180 [Leptomonas pyrrhocoris]|eukprot:XP_015662503.1 hypothetical protein ABB37_02180 [Leptomonas pyrrhocoris]